MRPNVHYTDPAVTIWHGDSIETLRELPDNSIDSIVTDPPYGLGFMGKAWDALPPGEEWARECLRVLKPGGHLLAFGRSRTWHRLAVAVEDAGFEIRDSLFWHYGSGFPKSHDVGKSTGDQKWSGWGTALKPATEPIVMARKPLQGTVAGNVQTWGTGALNIDATRIGTTKDVPASASAPQAGNHVGIGSVSALAERSGMDPNVGRWPANVVLDETTAEILDQQSGITSSHVRKDGRVGQGGGAGLYNPNEGKPTRESFAPTDSGGASRFFYVAKAPKRERPVVDGIAHPTVQPLALMRWLVKLVTPPGGVVLDPFEGSGTTLEACLLEGFNHVGIEREADYLPLIMSRVDRQAGTLPHAA